MKLTIIFPDDIVIIDGIALKVDCSAMSPGIHAVQWNGQRGHIEYAVDDVGNKKLNDQIEDVAQFQPIIDSWNAAKAQADLRAANGGAQ
jgi:hypothetical protein